ncbi:hypothetical protein BD410DRAFT_786401 [Rickenella mellea]|uniref:GDP/GTP exchange factor Sec2 N-terminal domain-containing protein n=1 Tax=Rickenella mellea TaxID=50990 RepID=A0A4Y7QB32_9AGAM|nr:hypothetical protein BD410DRAFT_786401 [Rickenella mellea]
MQSRLPPPRSDSLKSKTPVLVDELRDVKRVQTHGQEEDLRDALGHMIARVEELSSLLSQAYKEQTELETSLKLAKSNLQLALANNEMLEDALKRDGPGLAKDVGWRRWSEREGAERQRAYRMSLDGPNTSSGSQDGFFTPNQGNGTPSSSSPVSPAIPIHSPSPNPVPSPSPNPDGIFRRFRFGSGTSATGTSSRGHSPPARASLDHAHLTSASLPSLVSGPSKREEELLAQLEAERTSHKKAMDEKKELEAELESLSQALFEEANKMVAHERIKRAETEDELRQARAEKEALRGAMRVIESENGRLRSTSSTGSTDDLHITKVNGRDTPDSMRTEKRSSRIHIGNNNRDSSQYNDRAGAPSPNLTAKSPSESVKDLPDDGEEAHHMHRTPDASYRSLSSASENAFTGATSMRVPPDLEVSPWASAQ